MVVTNIAYREREKRSFLKKFLLSFGFAVGAILVFLVILFLVVALPIVLNEHRASPGVAFGIDIARLVLLWLVGVLALAIAYRYAPARERASWRWVTWGSVISCSLWLIGTVLFSMYVRTFAGYGRFFGAVGGIVVLLVWFFMSAVFVVLGAEINAETERQTGKDNRAR